MKELMRRVVYRKATDMYGDDRHCQGSALYRSAEERKGKAEISNGREEFSTTMQRNCTDKSRQAEE